MNLLAVTIFVFLENCGLVAPFFHDHAPVFVGQGSRSVP